MSLSVNYVSEGTDFTEMISASPLQTQAMMLTQITASTEQMPGQSTWDHQLWYPAMKEPHKHVLYTKGVGDRKSRRALLPRRSEVVAMQAGGVAGVGELGQGHWALTKSRESVY